MAITKIKKYLSLCVCIVLIAAIALFTTGCDNNQVTGDETSTADTSSDEIVTDEVVSETEDATELGDGQTSFLLTVTYKDASKDEFSISTDKTTVGDALAELGLIEGEEGAYGLYIKTVNGVTADYDVDGTYWAFYINGEYASTGADLTNITEGAHYEFKVE